MHRSGSRPVLAEFSLNMDVALEKPDVGHKNVIIDAFE